MHRTKHVVHMTTVHHPLDTRIYYKQCQSLKKAGYCVTLIAPSTGEAIPKDEITMVPIAKYRNKLLRMLFSTVKAYRKARQLKGDYYHIHDPELLPVAWLLKKKDNIVIYDIHEDYVTSIMQKEYIMKPIRRVVASAYKWIEGALSRRLELCLAEKYYKDLYPRGQCILNYPVLNPILINHRSDDHPAKHDLIYTGNVSAERGAYIHAKLPLLDPDISVSFIGECPRRVAEKIDEIAGDERDRLTIEGIDQYIPREEIDAKYVSRRWLAGLALFPPNDHYKRKELTKFFEYMSAGIPILCSDFPAWKNFVEKHACGIAVNPYDERAIKSAINYLRTNPDEAKKMGENGRRAVMSDLNWQAEEEKLIQWYHKIGSLSGGESFGDIG